MKAIVESGIASLPVLDYPPITEDLEEARGHVDEYGLAIIGNARTPEEVAVTDRRLEEQSAGDSSILAPGANRR